MLYGINWSSIPQHTNTVVRICGTNDLDWDKLSVITNEFICAVSLLQPKQKKLKIVVSGILPRNKGRRFGRKKLIETNKCSLILNVIIYLEIELSWVKQNSELNMELHYKDELHFIGKVYKKFVNSTSKKSKN